MTYPTRGDLLDVAEKYGYTIDGVECCPFQGVIVSYSRPTEDGETFMGLPVAGPRVESEVIERHYCPEIEAPMEVQRVTWGRAIQRTIWGMESEAAPSSRERPGPQSP